MRKLGLLALTIMTVGITGCDKAGTAPQTSKLQDPGEPREAQPKLQTLKLWLGPEELNAELALTMNQIRTGMMFRTNMAENEAMLFVFSVPHRAGFWMKNTVLPLSAAYIDSEGRILEVHDLQPGNTNSVIAASDNVQYVLETRQGWFERHNVRPGTVLRTERGTLRQTFMRR